MKASNTSQRACPHVRLGLLKKIWLEGPEKSVGPASIM